MSEANPPPPEPPAPDAPQDGVEVTRDAPSLPLGLTAESILFHDPAVHPASSPVAEPTDGSRGFRVHPVFILLALGVTGVLVARALPFVADDPRQIGLVLGRGMGWVLLLFIVAAGAWRVFGRSGVAANLAFLAVLVAQMGLGLNALQTASAGTSAGTEAAAAPVFGPSPPVESARDSDRDAIIAGVMAEAASREGALVERYRAAVAALLGAGGADPAGLSLPADFDARVALIRRADSENDAMIAHVRSRRAATRAALVRAGISGGEADAALDAATPSWVTQATISIRQTDAEMFRSMRGRLEILRDTLGHWGVDAGPTGVVFHASAPEGTAEAFARLCRTMRAAADRQLELQRSLGRRATAKQAG